jgi:hypothetical protein
LQANCKTTAMKKFSFTLFFLLMFLLAGFSQYYQFGIKLGITSNYLRFSNEHEKLRSQKTGFNIGALNHFQLGKHFAMQSNFQVAMKGGHLHDIEFTTWHFEVPLNFLFTDGGFFIGGGPNISFGLFGRAKDETPDPDGEKHDFLFRQPEGGLNAVIGFTIAEHLLFQANFSHGLHNLIWGEDNYKVRPKSLGFTVAYLFGKYR